MALATNGKKGLWSANVYYAVDKSCNLYFMSDPKTHHCQDIAKNKKVSCAIASFDPKDLSNRNGVQMTGVCEQVRGIKMIHALRTYTQVFKGAKKWATLKFIKNKAIHARPYVIRPNYIKFWSDKLFGEEGTREFNF